MGISKKRLVKTIEEHRDHNAWRRKDGGEWSLRDPIWLQDDESVPTIEKVRLKMVDEAERTFSPKNQALHYNVGNPPIPTGESEMDERPDKFEWL